MTAVIKLELLDRDQATLLQEFLGVDPRSIASLEDAPLEIDISGDQAFIFYRAMAITSANAVHKFLGEIQ